jgi:hypothetical protein
MYRLKLIGLTVLNFLREVWRAPQAIADAARERRRQTRRDTSEIERLDRIRNPWKYLGR